MSEPLGTKRPVVQAGMGGGVARHELAAAVSEAGGLGTLGLLPPERLREELAAARRLTAHPIAVNLLLPFAAPAHWEVAARADAVVTFWGRPERRTPRVWIHQCGSVAEALAAHAAGADAVIAQGREAGGHVRGTTPALELLEQVRAALPAGFPVLVAGALADAGDVRRALDAGAAAAVLGTRFLLSEESRAHPRYKRAALEGRDTVLTELFGLGWPAAPHRVLPNAATRRWPSDGGSTSRALGIAQRVLSPLARRAPEQAQQRAAAAQRPALPLLSPFAPVDDAPLGRLLDAGALYAGETVARIDALAPAERLVRDLTP
ncbi:MAG TPA: nitronate monooxygenase [Thermoleophilaceae bacterium]|nr:nitronate monooxygenase [Thermoleophilaceae bacterium]